MMKTNLSPNIAAKKECEFGPRHGRPHRLGHRLHRGRAGGEDGLPPGTLIPGDRVFAYLLEYYPAAYEERYAPGVYELPTGGRRAQPDANVPAKRWGRCGRYIIKKKGEGC